MAGKSTYLQNKLIDFIFRGQPFPDTYYLYLALFTTSPVDWGFFTEWEVAGGNYLRMQTTPGLWSITTGPTGITTATNNSVIQWPKPTTPWGEVGWFGIIDAPTGFDHLLYWGTLARPRTFSANDSPPRFEVGQLVISED